MFCLQYNPKSLISFLLSFIFPVTFITVLNMFSKKFSSMCITSKLCLNKLSFQYGRSQKMILFVQLCDSSYPFILVSPLSMTFGKCFMLLQTCNGVKLGGGPSVSAWPFRKALLFLLKWCSLGKNLRCE